MPGIHADLAGPEARRRDKPNVNRNAASDTQQARASTLVREARIVDAASALSGTNTVPPLVAMPGLA